MAGRIRRKRQKKKRSRGGGGGASDKTLAIPKLVHDVISAPFTTVRPTNIVQRDFPVMLPKSQLLYKLTDSDPTYPIKVRAPDTATKVEARKTKPVTTKTDMSTKIMNEYERRVKLGELITLNDFTRYGTLGGPEVKRRYVHRV